MQRFARDLARAARPGDCIALSGDLGAGKSTFARAFIRAVANDPQGRLDVPSPTFTLVQTYATRPPVSHFDLYRIGDPDEIGELGLHEALEGGIVLVEWPERAADRLPAATVTIGFADATTDSGAQARLLTIDADAPFFDRLDRSLAIRRLLAEAGHADAWRAELSGDASARDYEIAKDGDWQRVLMDAPATFDDIIVRDGMSYCQLAYWAEDIVPFVAIRNILAEAGLTVPRIDRADFDAGLILMEDLGRQGIIDAERRPIADRYLETVACLAQMHAMNWPQRVQVAPGRVHEIPTFDLRAFLVEVDLLIDWFVPRVTGAPASDADRAQFHAIWTALFERLDAGPRSLVLRDYHSPNTIWQADRTGIARVGLIDFQDAVFTHPAYDVVSLAQDARVDVPEALEAALVDHYCALRADADPAFDEAAFRRAAAICAAQRNSRILGIFVRLDERDGKPAYLPHIARLQGYLARSLAHPVLAELKAWYEARGLLTARLSM
ncbi:MULTISPECIES: tRNA (adenosine(37)-N6)-threonylcarbamoyltransferase complex ATPase subunit type 1 TsaE [unclassified Roseitalea]|uniref:tRNA (adenosine(37)-N6)-threonylcarbamoyltransferase complex ATPase subunit type 1 TsaE n=1 Tax=unclassified Roseitalea TaxID=2639107 RepID=UPI00273DA714|nr:MULTISPECIES: tRNA (adenosine(37)-N6)-threonylcarbamoyltransferase complex ATPase subunit type 1 TsaE [unclassified Roseitalea]